MKITSRNTRSFIHLGTTKTGSSFIQQRIFSRAKGAIYFHNEFDRVTQAMRSDARTADLGRPLDPEKKAIFSHESLHGRPADRMAPLLRRTFGDATILLVTRQPAKWAESFYFQRIRNGDDRDPPTWLSENIEGLARQMDFDRVHSAYAGVFGAENVHILPYEMLRDAPQTFLEHLGRIAGLSFDPAQLEIDFVNRSASAGQMEAIRKANASLNTLIGNDEDLMQKLTDFRHALVRKLAESPEARPDADTKPVFPEIFLRPLYENMSCLENYPWYPEYRGFYRLDG